MVLPFHSVSVTVGRSIEIELGVASISDVTYIVEPFSSVVNVAYTGDAPARLIVRSMVCSMVTVRITIEVQNPRPSSMGVGVAGEAVTVRSNSDVR
jgi:hypothetical protein